MVTVVKGTEVKWRNRDATAHDVTGGGWGSGGSLAQDARFRFTFDTPGTYPYVCTIHPSMKGTITVTG